MSWEKVAEEARRKLGGDVVVLAHHYQRDEVVAQADFVGDSLELARRAAATEARFLVFCGVRFMAETAALLARPDQKVFHPRPEAGCFLADQAPLSAVRQAWETLGTVVDVEREVLPVAYINTTAEVKAFVGEKGGVCCTSSNAEKVLRWAFSLRPRVFFLPDLNLGQNTARRLGLAPDEVAVWDPRFPPEDLSSFGRARLILWRGACNVHVRFLPQDVEETRRRHPGVRVLVHPECRPEVVALADEVGSTSFMVRRVRESPVGTTWAIGTEHRLVARLARENPDKTVISLGDPPPFCPTMSMLKLEHLARTLSALAAGQGLAPVAVPGEVARHARAALHRMLEVGA